MSKTWKLSLIVLTVVLIIAGAGSLFYFNTKLSDPCSKILEKYSENALCISTNKGNMVFELYPDSGPKSVERIKKLSNDKYYDGLEFYRVVKDFVVQGGIQDYRIRNSNVDIQDSAMKEKVRIATDENIDVETNFEKVGVEADTITQLTQAGYKNDDKLNARKFEYGSLAFANQGDQNPNTNSIEFFAVTATDPNSENMKFLNGRFTNMGKLVEGDDVLKKLNNLEIDQNYLYSNDKSHPFETITIYEMRAK